MEPVAYAENRRLDYHETGQEYADYLDYVDEWKGHRGDQRKDTISVILNYYVINRKPLDCICQNTHYLVKGQDATETMIQTTCWYRTIAAIVDSVFDMLKNNDFCLPTPLEIVLTKIVGWKHTNTQTTPTLLPYETFLEVWWNKTQEECQDMALRMLNALPQEERKTLAVLKQQQTPHVEKGRAKILLNFIHLEHSLHVFLKALGPSERTWILKFLNRKRSEIDNNAQIPLREFNKAILECKECKVEDEKSDKRRNVLSPMAIYYGPPGMGKTTAQSLGRLIAFDTDWLGVGPTWIDYGEILRRNIPIITNQAEIFIGVGLKIIGVVNDNVRLDAYGKPFTTKDNVVNFSKRYSKEMILVQMRNEEHLSDYAARMEAMAIISRRIANYSVNQLPFYRNEQDYDWAKRFPKFS